jgi:2-haloacid dehalogenase
MKTGVPMRPVLLFDVNETLLDLRALDPIFDDVLGDAALRPAWFAQTLQLSFVGGITGEYVNFTMAQRAALTMIAERAHVPITAEGIDRIVDAMSSLPAHPEVPQALSRLTDAGFRLATLTNSVGAVAQAQVDNAGIRDRFELVLSADTVSALKPSAAPYRMAAEAFDVAISDTWLIAAHSWDISGALVAGCQAAFVRRSGAVLSPIGPRPEIIGQDIADVAEQLVQVCS